MSESLPKPEQKFTPSLWTMGNIGLDPFGAPLREQHQLTIDILPDAR